MSDLLFIVHIEYPPKWCTYSRDETVLSSIPPGSILGPTFADPSHNIHPDITVMADWAFKTNPLSITIYPTFKSTLQRYFLMTLIYMHTLVLSANT